MDNIRDLAEKLARCCEINKRSILGAQAGMERILRAELKPSLELAEIVLKLQHEQQKWLTAGGRNAMKPAFALAAELMEETG